MTEAVPVFTGQMPRVRLVEIDRPWVWLAAGWRDFTAAPRVSLAYGALLVWLSYALLAVALGTEAYFLILPMTAGFFFIAPVLGMGLYETSRRLAAGEPVSLGSSLQAFRSNTTQVAFFGALLMLFHLAWIRIATLLYALFFDDMTPGWGHIIDAILNSGEGLPFLIVGSIAGAFLAVIVFAISAVSIPMLMARPDTNVFTAVATSVAAVQINWRPMALWAALIVIFTALGLVVFFIGLAVAMPLIGHASWHAYKDLVE